MFTDFKRLYTDASGFEKFFLIYLLIYFGLQYLIAFYIPGADYDSNAMYMTRVKLEEFGQLRAVASIDHQYFFPKFWSDLHWPFLKMGYFELLPSFSLFLFTLMNFVWVIRRLKLPLDSFLFILIFCCEPIMSQSLSWKEDFALGSFALFSCTYITFGGSKKWYLPISLLSLCMIVGTKWFGVSVASFLFVALIVRAFRNHLYSLQTGIFLLIAVPFYLWVSSFKTYLCNVLIDHSLFPTPSMFRAHLKAHPEEAAKSATYFIRAAYKLISNIVTAPLDLISYLSDQNFGTHFIDILKGITLGAKAPVVHLILYPSQDISRFGWEFAIVNIFSLACLLGKNSFELKFFSALSLFSFVFTFGAVGYTGWYDRYYILTYMLALLPAYAFLIKRQCKKNLRSTFCAYAIFVSAHSITCSIERKFVSFPGKNSMSTVWKDLFDRDMIRFQVWSGYGDLYRVFRSEIKNYHRLAFVDGNLDELDAPFIYPFLRNREASNTAIYIRKLEQASIEISSFDYLLAYKFPIASDDFELMQTNPLSTINLKLYRKKKNDKRS